MGSRGGGARARAPRQKAARRTREPVGATGMDSAARPRARRARLPQLVRGDQPHVRLEHVRALQPLGLQLDERLRHRGAEQQRLAALGRQRGQDGAQGGLKGGVQQAVRLVQDEEPARVCAGALCAGGEQRRGVCAHGRTSGPPRRPPRARNRRGAADALARAHAPRAREALAQAAVGVDQLRQPPGRRDDDVGAPAERLGLRLLLHAADDDALLGGGWRQGVSRDRHLVWVPLRSAARRSPPWLAAARRGAFQAAVVCGACRPARRATPAGSCPRQRP